MCEAIRDTPLLLFRLQDPVPASPWDGDLDASELPPPCDQLVVLGREDCLYINVYTPEVSVLYIYFIVATAHTGIIILFIDIDYDE